MPQSITIDLGKVYNNISTIYCVPKYKTVATVVNNGSIESYKISTSTDNINFTLINSGIWSGDTKMKIASFIPTSARYIKVEALSAVDGYAAVTEFEIGQETPTGIKNDQGVCHLVYFSSTKITRTRLTRIRKSDTGFLLTAILLCSFITYWGKNYWKKNWE